MSSVSIPADTTNEPVNISPYTIGIAIPALLVFCTPLKEKLRSCGSSETAGGFGMGNNISVAPESIKLAPIPVTIVPTPTEPAPRPKVPIAAPPNPPVAIVAPIRIAPVINLPIPLLAPTTTGIYFYLLTTNRYIKIIICNIICPNFLYNNFCCIA